MNENICKEIQDALDFANGLMDYTEEMLCYSHKGESCWLSGNFCQEGWCSDCSIYQEYLAKEVNRR